uniref:Uncharacterized protein n=1 Tax=Periophthalmus magnuspinnatus TaxID=409849 RepID=A0A3B4AMF9_9GOBI
MGVTLGINRGNEGAFARTPRAGAREETGGARPAWVIGVLASVLIFTTVVDVLGNLLVIISVFRNRKLRNSGKRCPLWMMQRLRKCARTYSTRTGACAL